MVKRMNEDFGKYLRRIRKSKNITLVQLAKKTGLSQPYLSQIENGKREIPKPDIVNKLCIALDDLDLMSKAGYIKTIKVGYMDEEFKKILQEENELRKKKDILYLLQNEEDNAYYNGQMLSKEDRKRVLTVLENLFPEYHKD